MIPKITFAAIALAACQLLHAAEPVLVLPDYATSAGQFTFRNLAAVQCSVPDVGDCGSFAVGCESGQAAYCRPGKLADPINAGVCIREPTCICKPALPAKK